MASSNPLTTSGIYCITCTPTGDRYIGKATNIRNRWYSHKRQFKKGFHDNPVLFALVKSYGAQAFSFSVLEECSVSELERQEMAWCDTLRPSLNRKVVASGKWVCPGTPKAQLARLCSQWSGKTVTSNDLIRIEESGDVEGVK